MARPNRQKFFASFLQKSRPSFCEQKEAKKLYPLQAPPQAAVLTWLGWGIAEQGGAEFLVDGAVPDAIERLRLGVTQGVILVAAGAEGGDAAG
jgi:hypothetical protein